MKRSQMTEANALEDVWLLWHEVENRIKRIIAEVWGEETKALSHIEWVTQCHGEPVEPSW